MSDGLDDKLARALALSVAQQPRANLQQLARSAGISKATLYRIAPTRDAVIDLLLERATQYLQDALVRAELETPPYAAALQRLTEAVVQGREFYMFWNHAQWVRVIDSRTVDLSVPIPSFYGQALEHFFLNGQKAGVFRIDVPSLWLVRAYDFLLYAAIDAAQRGEIAPLGMTSMVQKLFLEGASDARG
ncbi:TetR/AcrR family transcriptional regulator [Achromobacter xylosoxidans]|uniref:TetR/AcrR family transcriptional regulator n=1 Tax=Alcaligenes xylosoxydans xylosoxydans TaxID=85698 RepID=UPI0015C7AA17|nr:TetR/AcrR family transcriptional regulator [Achromobacter xylosoxidans]NYS12522.1 TetR/AcrR family transcriptional regulator [Achromobacter xylosoxidans]